MTEEQEKQIKKIYTPEEYKDLKNLIDSIGINKRILETENIRANTSLVNATLKKFKNEFWHNIIFIIVGAIIGYLPNLLNEDKTTKAIELMNTLSIEKQKQHEYYQIELRQMRLELSSLKNEINNIRKE